MINRLFNYFLHPLFDFLFRNPPTLLSADANTFKIYSDGTIGNENWPDGRLSDNLYFKNDATLQSKYTIHTSSALESLSAAAPVPNLPPITFALKNELEVNLDDYKLVVRDGQKLGGWSVKLKGTETVGSTNNY